MYASGGQQPWSRCRQWLSKCQLCNSPQYQCTPAICKCARAPIALSNHHSAHARDWQSATSCTATAAPFNKPFHCISARLTACSKPSSSSLPGYGVPYATGGPAPMVLKLKVLDWQPPRSCPQRAAGGVRHSGAQCAAGRMPQVAQHPLPCSRRSQTNRQLTCGPARLGGCMTSTSCTKWWGVGRAASRRW